MLARRSIWRRPPRDFPQINFIVYHSGYRGAGLWSRGTGDRVDDPKVQDRAGNSLDQRHLPHSSPQSEASRNIYFELGSTFQQLSMSDPVRCLHMLGQMLQTGGADHILWGTDCIWGGSPQSQIERFRRMQMTDELMTKYQYPQLTDAIKNQILGLNAARLFNVNVKANRNAIKADKLTQLRAEYRQNPMPVNTQYGWLWTDAVHEPTIPIGTPGVE